MLLRSFAAAALVTILATSCGIGNHSLEPSIAASVMSAAPIPCLGPLVSAEEVVALDPAQQLACFGDMPLTMVVFFPQVFGAGGCDGSIIPADGWLWPCFNAGLGVVAEPGSELGMTIYLSPASGIKTIDVRPNQWLRVTGHFDDAAAQRCRTLSPAGQVVEDPQLVQQCRELFAVTELEVVPGPT